MLPRPPDLHQECLGAGSGVSGARLSMPQAERSHEQGLERCCSRLGSAAFLPITEGLAHGQHLNHPQGLLPSPGSHHALLGTAACPSSPAHPIQGSSGTHCSHGKEPGGFNPEPRVLLQSLGHLNFNCIRGHCWGGEKGARLLQTAAASRLPAPPRASFRCRQGRSRQGGFQSSQSASAAQPSPITQHVAVHEQLRQHPASGPATFQGPSNTRSVG